MAHSAQINVNGVLTAVTEFDNSAQAIDDAVAVLGAPTTPQAALAALGAGVRPNLLDNAYFVGGGSQQGGGQMPINQTGATSWTGSVSYVALFDRWLGYYTGGGVTFSITSDGVVIPVTSSYATILQRLLQPNSSMAGKTYTVSAIVGGELISATGEVTAVSSGDSAVFMTTTGSNGCRVRLRYSPTNGMFFEVYTPNGGVTVECCKLEEGEGQTLAYKDSTGAWHRLPQPEDGDYAGQLAKCEYYHKRFSGNTGVVGFGFAVSSSTSICLVSLPNGIRIKSPTVTLSGTIYAASEAGFGSGSIAITNQPSSIICPDGFNLLSFVLSISGLGIQTGTIFSLQFRDSTSYLDIAADL